MRTTMRMPRPTLRLAPLSTTHDGWLLVAAMLLPLLFMLYFSAAPADAAKLLSIRPAPYLVTLPDRSRVKPMVDNSAWQQMRMLSPEVIGQATIPEYRFINQGALPALHIDGQSLNFTLPPALWVKLENPGQAFLYIDSDAGLFVKPLNEATPGFVSRCPMTKYGYADAEGEPVELNTADLKINALWIVQDAGAGAAQTPGWISVAPPKNEPTMIAKN